MTTATDPRPLTGEPVSLDLLNTRWNEEGVRQDLLTGVEGLAVWLATNGLEGRFAAGDTVDLCSPDGHVVARGLVAYDSTELAPLVGRRLAGDLVDGGRTSRTRPSTNPATRTVVRRDDLVVL